MKSTLSQTVINGVPVTVPNVVDNSPRGYYISYNNHDINIYGCATTCIGVNHSGAFLILNGDHRGQLAGLSLKEACQYFHDNVALKNFRSDNHQDDVLEKVDGVWAMVRKDFDYE